MGLLQASLVLNAMKNLQLRHAPLASGVCLVARREAQASHFSVREVCFCIEAISALRIQDAHLLELLASSVAIQLSIGDVGMLQATHLLAPLVKVCSGWPRSVLSSALGVFTRRVPVLLD